MPNNVAVVTGASSGLGLELALLATKDFFVIGVSRSTPSDERWKALESEGRCRHILGDVSFENTVTATLRVAQEAGALSLLINCAGAGIFGPIGSYSRSDIDSILSGNLIGTILFSQAAFPLIAQTGGFIVNIMSTAAQTSRANESVYCSAKWAARGFSEVLRLEAKGTKAKVICVYPGGMNTNFWSMNPEAKANAMKFSSPSEVAAVIFASLSPGTSSYVSDITVNRI